MNLFVNMVKIILVTSLLSGANLVSAEDAKELLNTSCIKCHTSEIYTRDNHKVKDLMGLHTQVEACNTQLGTGWFPEDTNEVVEYLNKHHYKFKTK